MFFNRYYVFFNSKIILGIILISLVATATAHTPPQGDDASVLNSTSDIDERFRRMHRLETYRVGAGLKQRVLFKLNRARLEAAGLSPSEIALALNRGPLRAFPFQANPELASTGAVRTLTLLIDFEDHQADDHLPGLTAQRISQNIYGSGTSEAQDFVPFESAHEYYRRASEGTLDLQGDVIGWIRLAKNRSEYEPQYPIGASEQQKMRIDNQALFDLISTALDEVDANTDFSQYDNDHDGDIDLITVMYAGPNNGWGGFWWAYRWEFFIPEAFTKKFDGKRLKQFVFQFVKQRGPGGNDFDPTTLAHETGHALGLPDYYDYCSTQRFEAGLCSPSVTAPGPDGGVGGLDIMHANKGNHNAFSRWLLDWIDPIVIGSNTSATIELAASGDVGSRGAKAVAVFPGLQDTDAPGQELFIIENRIRAGNDDGSSQMPGDGILIWHVDARPNTSNDDFVFDNSFTTPKLIRLVRAQTTTDFNDGEGANALDYFTTQDEFTPTTTPSSVNYAGQPTGVSITNIIENGNTISVDVGIEASPSPSFTPREVTTSETPNFEVTARDFSRAMTLPDIPEIDLSRIEQFDKEFRTANAKDLAELWETHNSAVTSSLNKPSEARILAELLLTHWASKDGKAAVEALLEYPNTGFTYQIFPEVITAWALNNPQDANDWYFAPEQAELRENRALIAGEQFAAVIFRWRAMSSPDKAAEAIDQLNRTAEIYGAIEGLRATAAAAGADANAIVSQLEELKVRSREARALVDLQSEIENASRQLQSLDKSDEVGRFLQQKLRGIGFENR